MCRTTTLLHPCWGSLPLTMDGISLLYQYCFHTKHTGRRCNDKKTAKYQVNYVNANVSSCHSENGHLCSKNVPQPHVTTNVKLCSNTLCAANVICWHCPNNQQAQQYDLSTLTHWTSTRDGHHCLTALMALPLLCNDYALLCINILTGICIS